jgi:lipopolysaccharide transport system ATP-binding protein
MIDLKFDRVSKRYLIRQDVDDQTRSGLKRKLSRLWQRPHDFWAVRDVSFEVRRGEALGIIGHNGAGKSTILKLLAGITSPSSGEIMINGRLSALVEVGSGFHPELTGRENVYLSGSILGMRRSEIKRKVDSIIDFAGISEFIDTPVKRYSSGMYVRLGFSIAAHLEPDILLLDEVLAVGDGEFQLKCMKRIKELEQAGVTIVFISHDLKAIERVCDRVILMEHGQIVANGVPTEVIKHYAPPTVSKSSDPQRELCFHNRGPNPSLPFEVERIEVLDQNENIKSILRTGDYVKFRIVWRASRPVEDAGVGFSLYTLNDIPVMQCSTSPISGMDVKFHAGLNVVDVEFQQFPLTSGDYRLAVSLTRPMIEFLYRGDNFAGLPVKEGDMFGSGFFLTTSDSLVAVPHRWIVPNTAHDSKIESLMEA